MNDLKPFLDFLQQLAANNNKPWFDEHKDEYKTLKKDFDAFAMEFLHGIEQFDPRVKNLQLKDITYRIYRDLRFSPDKRPYKQWHGVYVCPRGKKSGMAGYYIHFEPATDTYFLCGGLYNPSKEVIKSVREYIMLEPDDFHQAVESCGSAYHLNWDSALKKMPMGYSEADTHSEYYRLRSYEIYKPLTKQDVLKKNFLKNALTDLQKTYKFNEMLNKCFDYAYDD